MDFNVIDLSNQECVGYYYCKVQTAIGLQYARNPKIRNIQLYISNFHCPNWVWLEVVKLFNQNHSDVKIVRSSTLNMIEHSGTICYTVEYSKEREMTLEEIEKELGYKVKIEQWKEEANKYQNLWCIATDDIFKAKSKATKEFAERLKNKIKTECNPYGKPTFDYDTSISIIHYIDKLVKEMVDDTE